MLIRKTITPSSILLITETKKLLDCNINIESVYHHPELLSAILVSSSVNSYEA